MHQPETAAHGESVRSNKCADGKLGWALFISSCGQGVQPEYGKSWMLFLLICGGLDAAKRTVGASLNSRGAYLPIQYAASCLQLHALDFQIPSLCFTIEVARWRGGRRFRKAECRFPAGRSINQAEHGRRNIFHAGTHSVGHDATGPFSTCHVFQVNLFMIVTCSGRYVHDNVETLPS